MIRTYKYRLRPTKKQAFILKDIFFQMQAVYNDALNERRWYWQRSRRSISYYDQWPRIRDERHALPGEMGLLNATSIQQMLRRVNKAYRKFYKEEKAGLPRFKSAKRFKSVEYKHGDGSKVKGDRLYIQYVGDIKIRLHRPIPEGAKIKHVVLKREQGHWYVALMLDIPDPKLEPQTGSAIGIDPGLHNLLALSDGTLINNPRWLRNSLKELRVANRRLSRRKRCSGGWYKAKRQVSKIHRRIANQRLDFYHKITTQLAQDYSFIATEKLRVGFMTRNRNLALSAHDAALGMFRQMLEYKVEKTGARFVAVNPHNTTQMCSGCGEIVRKELKNRTHECTECGLVLDRDVNAARNILRLGLSLEAPTYLVADCVASEAPLL
ncbi:MAG: IS200/IS605 family element transposase accessory protein TnpB [Bacteroidales bacterium]|nr:IS200/IS605 family element transposase accessory protein TnpB [Bacteroidales bacterium]